MTTADRSTSLDFTGPVVFRVTLEVADLEAGERFYEQLLEVPGSRQPGSRSYFVCGGVVLQILDVSARGAVHALPQSLYLASAALEQVYERARRIGCLDAGLVHGEPAGAIRVRPWGERSFYVEDPWGNSLCFVEHGTAFMG